ncbi:hypothetical protein SEA_CALLINALLBARBZ_52 [Arthrobacter phage CallinAllBarbz]|uniref:Uncharacterized protein n=1 Tax=Arthrobacter phage CallinAllBarbz TaxID=3077790 RepID=A0AA96KAX2_9CAUD|nr:hypothetical protein SEA_CALLINALLBARBZ_52 [Arthrobacter phage CallinAllBarbz]
MNTETSLSFTDSDGDEIQIANPYPAADPDAVAYVKTSQIGAHLTAPQAEEAARVLLALSGRPGNVVVELPPVVVQHSEYDGISPMYTAGGTIRRPANAEAMKLEETRALEVLAIAHAARRVDAEKAAREEAEKLKRETDGKVERLAVELYLGAGDRRTVLGWHNLPEADRALYRASVRAAIDHVKAMA